VSREGSPERGQTLAQIVAVVVHGHDDRQLHEPPPTTGTGAGPLPTAYTVLPRARWTIRKCSGWPAIRGASRCLERSEKSSVTTYSTRRARIAATAASGSPAGGSSSAARPERR